MASTITFCAAPSASVTIVPSILDRYLILFLLLLLVVVLLLLILLVLVLLVLIAARLFLQLVFSSLLLTDTPDAHIMDEVDEEQQDGDKERPIASIAIRRIGSDAAMDDARQDVANENKSIVSAGTFFVSMPLLVVVAIVLLLLLLYHETSNFVSCRI